MKVVLFGATRGIGRCMADQFAVRGDQVFVLGRDPDVLARVCGELAAGGATGTVGSAPCDLEEPDGFAGALEAAANLMGGIDTIVHSAAVFAAQDDIESDPVRATEMLQLNFTNTIAFCEAARRQLMRDGGGTLCVFSSVAGDRPRKPVILYGATKAGLSYYLDALDLTWADKGLRVVTVKPGFVLTDMTEGLDPPPFSAEAEVVADVVMRGLATGKRVIYAPPIWRLVMTAIRSIPRVLFRRLNI
jgi:short-subunit dehydrogenase